MQQNLDALLEEVEKTLAERNFAVFRGLAREFEVRAQVAWDTDSRPDFREFLKVAETLGVRLVVLHRQTLDAAMIESTLERIELADLPLNERRDYERQIERLRAFDGFACSIQLSFDFDGITYLYELSTPWYTELLDIADEIDASVEARMMPGPDGPMDYYSQN